MYMCNRSLDLHKAETVQFYTYCLSKYLMITVIKINKKIYFSGKKTIISTREKHFIGCSQQKRGVVIQESLYYTEEKISMPGQKQLPVGEKMDIQDPVGEVGDITKTSGKRRGACASYQSSNIYFTTIQVDIRYPQRLGLHYWSNTDRGYLMMGISQCNINYA